MITLRLDASGSGGDPAAQLVLPYEQRVKSRLRVRLATGEEAAVFLPRGYVLRSGERLLADDGRSIEVVAAAETVSVVCADEPLRLARAAYHLGNRHVALQIGAGWLRYLHDPVLDELMRGLGLSVRRQQAPFEPETGAYGGHPRPAGDDHHAHD